MTKDAVNLHVKQFIYLTLTEQQSEPMADDPRTDHAPSSSL